MKLNRNYFYKLIHPNKSMLSTKSLFIIILIIFLLNMTIYNVSASISPDNVAFEKQPGDCYSIVKTVEIPQGSLKVDILFSFDTTNSMSEILNEANLNINKIINNLIINYNGVSFNFGVISYSDYPAFYPSYCGYKNGYGVPTVDYAYYLNQPITSDTYQIITAINSLNLGNGFDAPDDYTRIFYETYNDTNIGWRIDSQKILINFADSIPHDCNLNEGIYEGVWSTGVDPGPDEIIDTDDDLSLLDVLSTMNLNDITLIECHSSTNYLDYWEYWTSLTGGSVNYTTTSNFADVVKDAITNKLVIPKIYDLHLEVTTPGFENWLDSVIPSSYAEVNMGSTVTFEETICVPIDTTPGEYTFTISAIDGEGNNYGDQTDVVTVTAKSAPQQPSGPTNQPPVADASAGAPYLGVIGEDITFDGSNSYDPDVDGYIVSWYWKFDDGTDAYGEIVTHTYSTPDTYQASLKVTDEDGKTGTVNFNVEIVIANNPPTNLIVNGPVKGKQNIDYDYTASATDLDVGDMLRYTFDWGDGKTTTTEKVSSGVTVTVSHNWSTYGVYEVKVTVEDNYSAQTSTTFDVLIDVIVIDDVIQGFIIDQDGSDPFDVFDNTETDDETAVELDSGSYLIDSNGDSKWDYAYSSETGLITYYEFVYLKYLIIYQTQKATPGFELIILLVAIAIAALILRKKRKIN